MGYQRRGTRLTGHVFTHMSHIYPQGASIYTSYIFPNGKDYDTTMGYWRAMKRAASKAVVRGDH